MGGKRFWSIIDSEKQKTKKKTGGYEVEEPRNKGKEGMTEWSREELKERSKSWAEGRTNY